VRRLHHCRWALVVALAASVAIACRRDAQVTLRAVTLYVPKECPADSGAYAIYQALGDFEPIPPAKGHVLGNVGEALPEIDPSARAVIVQATEGSRQWLGQGVVPASGNVDVLVLPSLRSCSFSTLLGPRTGSTLGRIAGQRALVVGGTLAGTTLPTYALRLDTGALGPVPVSLDLLTPRTRATITPFGNGGLVAGGIDPRPGSVLDTAEVYAPELDGFDQQHFITLSTARADHGAAVLATGETLLVGGFGAAGEQSLLDSMEMVDPVTRTVRAENVARLAVARREPTVLRLASGEILVAGGFDGTGNAVRTVEWFSADASHPTKRASDLVAGSARAYMALEAGGALAVVAPPSNSSPGFQNTWVINADGALEPAQPIAGMLTEPVLFGGAGGAPVLWTGDRWLRWQPWDGAFGALGVLDDTPAHLGSATASPDTGLALWLDVTASASTDAGSWSAVTALRFDTRGEYSSVKAPLLVTDANETAPDRLASAGVISFDPSVGLELSPHASVFVTDRTYADVTVQVDAPTGEPALVVFRDELGNELEIGGATCQGAMANGVSASPLYVKRSGSMVTWSIGGGRSNACPGRVRQDARLAIGVRGAPGSTRSVARNLRIVRLGAP
jgi:hypothetical protein